MLETFLDNLTPYCERLTNIGYVLAEPVNVFSNLAFLAAAFLMRAETKRWDFWNSSLIALALMTGLGSSLFHYFYTAWSRWIDVVPLVAWILVFIGRFFSLLQFPRLVVVLVYALFVGVNLAFINYVDGALVANSNFYFGTFLIAALSTYLTKKYHPERFHTFAVATIVFGLSLVFRTLDTYVCPYFAVGTHFLWHVCNAYVMYLMYTGVEKLRLE